ncbi:Ubiquitin carboxyl-terminal hydrolase CYLD [Merluccius polli]|uniref:Ubiquitin carboxyl-terminal hydrolase CYLD n=1 Tax=Merluccius polli TaxID=89951 RepID=A0AA47NSX9_MERPO|nr:Ubiquitin carboxyl-terminal hydrolase CYLD [Merluccius polli]
MGFVDRKHIMKLREQLLDHGYCHTFTTDEKDPEEFLTIIMQHIMALEPLLKISAGGMVQESYCYQIFLDQNHSLVLPTVQQLLEHSFHSARLKLAESPSCLILQMPRFGKKFKMFDKIIPSLVLDVTDLLSEGPQECMLCGNLAHIECRACFKDAVFSQTGFKIFCKTCSDQVHSHPNRQAHPLSRLELPKDFTMAGASKLAREKMELFAVLCIETSHYVSFVKHGPASKDWIFFDSMSDREGGLDGHNIPQVQACPEVGDYLDMPLAELANQVPRDMKGVAKRLFCDAYMYLYQNTAQSLYR